ncbi:MAG TPA: BrnT family toxin [Phycisphaerae bacterium]|nr:BrnT family toxin [Phycisphaerae bacterium]
MFVEFEWDSRKAAANLNKHGVAFEEAATVFGDPLAAIFTDQEHSTQERREIIIGHSAQDRLIVVSFLERSGRIRIISARKATLRERQDYEENPLS